MLPGNGGWVTNIQRAGMWGHPCDLLCLVVSYTWLLVLTKASFSWDECCLDGRHIGGSFTRDAHRLMCSGITWRSLASNYRNPDSELQSWFMSADILRSYLHNQLGPHPAPGWDMEGLVLIQDHFSQYCHLIMWPSEPTGNCPFSQPCKQSHGPGIC